jgi:hypothetical protein
MNSAESFDTHCCKRPNRSAESDWAADSWCMFASVALREHRLIASWEVEVSVERWTVSIDCTASKERSVTKSSECVETVEPVKSDARSAAGETTKAA